MLASKVWKTSSNSVFVKFPIMHLIFWARVQFTGAIILSKFQSIHPFFHIRSAFFFTPQHLLYYLKHLLLILNSPATPLSLFCFLRVNPDRNIFSINVELTSTFFTLHRFGPSSSPNFKKETFLMLLNSWIVLKRFYARLSKASKGTGFLPQTLIF